MFIRKHNRIYYKAIVVFIFLFLNCFFAAGPALFASPIISSERSTTPSPVQNHNIEQEESLQFSNKNELRQDDPVAVRNKKKNVYFIKSVTKNFHNTSFCLQKGKQSIDGTFHLIRPAYYPFLSLFHLF